MIVDGKVVDKNSLVVLKKLKQFNKGVIRWGF